MNNLIFVENPLMPVLFIGHGSPMNAIEQNEFTQSWEEIAKRIPKPKTILCISAHWLTEGTAVTAMEKPRTIHDFYGFPEQLYIKEYRAPGNPELAKLIKERVDKFKISLDEEWGLDHGTWSVLRHMYPKADIPVIQLSLDYGLSLDKAFQIGKDISFLRSEGVLIIGSGNVVHNLMKMNPSGQPFKWALDFDAFVKKNILDKNFKNLIEYTHNNSSSLAHPTNDHYLPLIYTIGAGANSKVEFFNEKIMYSSLSMRCIAWGLND